MVSELSDHEEQEQDEDPEDQHSEDSVDHHHLWRSQGPYDGPSPINLITTTCIKLLHMNHLIWGPQILAIAFSHGLRRHITSDPPAQVTRSPQLDHPWWKTHSSVNATTMGSMSPEVLVIIQEARMAYEAFWILD